jgi:DNA-binding MarR family transcriptional regulator
MSSYARAARRIVTECPQIRVRQVSRLLTRVYDDALRPVGVQASQLSVLVAVAMFGEAGARMGALARVLVMERTTVTRNLRPLETAGWVRVGRSRDDARARVVTLTLAGERTIEAAYPRWEEAQRRIRDVMGAGKMASLRAQMGDIVALAPKLVGADAGF